LTRSSDAAIAMAMVALTIDSYVLDTLMADLVNHDRRPSAYLVYLAIWAAGDGGRIALSHADLAGRTGLSKRSVQAATGHLKRRGLIEVETSGPTDIPRYRPLTPWRRWRK
jgi:CRP-like cAMP-binding protein